MEPSLGPRRWSLVWERRWAEPTLPLSPYLCVPGALYPTSVAKTLKGVHGPPCGDGPARLPLWQSQGASRRDATLPAKRRPQTLVRQGLATASAGTPKGPGVACGLLLGELAY